MQWFHYIELHKDKVETDIQIRYAKEIHQLRGLGFNEEYYICEASFPLSAIILLDVVIRVAWNKDIYRLDRALRLFLYYPILIHEHGHTYVITAKHNTLFVTMLDDMTIIHTSMQPLWWVPSVPQQRYFRYNSDKITLADTWRCHEGYVQQHMKDGQLPISFITMQQASRVQVRIDEIQRGNTPAPWNDEEAAKKKQR